MEDYNDVKTMMGYRHVLNRAWMQSTAWLTDFEILMPVRITPRNIGASNPMTMTTRGLSPPPSVSRWRDMRTTGNRPASYAGRSKYCWS